MTIQDTLNYILIGNPVSQQLVSAGYGLARKTGLYTSTQKAAVMSTSVTPKCTPVVPVTSLTLWRLSGFNHNLIRIAGLSGASAVLLGAYGSHRAYDDEKGESKLIFETANRFHFIHTIALVAMPLSHRPWISGTLMVAGTILFTGPCYRKAFTGDNTFSKFAPIGGVVLIVAWLSLLL